MRLGGGGEMTKFVCGYFGCERHAERLFLAGLPLMIKINLRGDPAGEWLENSVRHLVSQAGSSRPGQSILLSKMAEALFIETIRRYMEALPAEQTGWLAGARDPVVGGALALLHRKPCHRWTVEELAAETGVSRSVLAERFSRFLGEPPLTYLARWRLQLAARMLQTTRESVIQVASEVGYELGSGVQPGVQARVRRSPGTIQKTIQGTVQTIALPAGIGRRRRANSHPPGRGVSRSPVMASHNPRSAGAGLPVDQSPLRRCKSTSGKYCCDPLPFGAMCSQGFV